MKSSGFIRHSNNNSQNKKVKNSDFFHWCPVFITTVAFLSTSTNWNLIDQFKKKYSMQRFCIFIYLWMNTETVNSIDKK